MKALIAALALATVFVTAKSEEEKKFPKDEGIYVLTEKNYDDAVKEFKYMLVYFYAPWCGHCKAFGPEYVKGGQQLKEKDSEIVFAKVDGTEQEELRSKMKVEGYPTLYFYREGEYIKYKGGRFAREMVEWVEKKIGPEAEPMVTADDVDKAVDESEVVVIGFFKDQESENAKNYKLAVKDYEEYRCGITSDDEAMKKHGAADGQVILFKKFDQGRAVYEGAIGKDAMMEFIQRYAIPLVVEFNHDTAQKIFRGLVKSHLLLFLNKTSDDFEGVTAMARKLAETPEFYQKVMFVTVDTDEDDHRRVIEYLGLKGERFPNMRIVQMKDDIEKYRPVKGEHDENCFREANVQKFVQDYLDGKVPQHFLTEDLPEDWNSKPCKYLTGSNFDEVVMDKTKNVLVEFYAPWCGHCKQLSPIWDKLAESLESQDDVIVAKMDATVNELSHTRVRSFPTIRLYKKESKDVAEYNGERTLEGLTKFLKSDGVYGMAAPDEPEPAPHDEL